MSKLHELLAVAGGLGTQADKVRQELGTTFDKKRHLFVEKRVTFQPNTEGASAVTEAQSDLQTTVIAQLRELVPFIAKAVDADFQIALANTVARADIIVEDYEGEDETLARNVPVTALLELEKRVGEIHQLLLTIPTLDPAKGFAPDPDKGDGVYRAREVRKSRTKKTNVPLVLHAPTKEHPAQVQLVTEDVVTGHTTEQEWSGELTSADKTDLINQCERLQRAVKAARARANSAEVDTTAKIGEKLLRFIIDG